MEVSVDAAHEAESGHRTEPWSSQEDQQVYRTTGPAIVFEWHVYVSHADGPHGGYERVS